MYIKCKQQSRFNFDLVPLSDPTLPAEGVNTDLREYPLLDLYHKYMFTHS